MLTLEQRLHMLECPTGTVDIVLDTDAFNEIDDQFAIAYALTAEKFICERSMLRHFPMHILLVPRMAWKKAIRKFLHY